MSWAAVPDRQHRHRPKDGLACELARVDIAARALLYLRPCRMIAESGAPARARATRPPWLETGPF